LLVPVKRLHRAAEEKVLQMQSTAPVIPRLGVPACDWRNEALHGVVQGRATVFPQAIGPAATWDVDPMKGVAEAVSALLGLEPALGIEPGTC
jgi:beta-glucosidase